MSTSILYHKLIESINLEDIFVKALSVDRNPIVLKEGEDLQADIQMKPQLQLITQEYLMASVSFYVTAQNLENEAIFDINFDYAVIYSIKNGEDFPEDKLEQLAQPFVERNVPLNVWPFARELIADLSGRMNVPRLLIGMYRYIPREMDEPND